MACPKCGCKVHYQFNGTESFSQDDERMERCAACGAIFDIEDSADEDDDEMLHANDALRDQIATIERDRQREAQALGNVEYASWAVPHGVQVGSPAQSKGGNDGA